MACKQTPSPPRLTTDPDRQRGVPTLMYSIRRPGEPELVRETLSIFACEALQLTWQAGELTAAVLADYGWTRERDR